MKSVSSTSGYARFLRDLWTCASRFFLELPVNDTRDKYIFDPVSLNKTGN